MEINTTKLLDGLTTILLALPAIILIFSGSIQAYAPPGYLIILMVLLAFVSQLAAGERSRFAVENIKKWKYFDYLTTIFLAAFPIVLQYQDQILSQVPVEYKIFVLILLAGLSQYASNLRVQKTEPMAASLKPSTINTNATITPDPDEEMITAEGIVEDEPGKES
ncbi:hypothetical protein [uncultured Methanobacterium sp.]|uniref:hypothetical protein n=1 Tax=uncultured Methanobacterium sp. TaxID=176306 RepID=UPI002AA68562|nr:hypothetical protein [uncultured Methanobacterium sp.]